MFEDLITATKLDDLEESGLNQRIRKNSNLEFFFSRKICFSVNIINYYNLRLIINYFSNRNKLFLKIKNNLFNKKSSKDNDKNRLIIIFLYLKIIFIFNIIQNYYL